MGVWVPDRARPLGVLRLGAGGVVTFVLALILARSARRAGGWAELVAGDGAIRLSFLLFALGESLMGLGMIVGPSRRVGLGAHRAGVLLWGVAVGFAAIGLSRG